MKWRALLLVTGIAAGAAGEARALSVGECFPAANLKAYFQEYKYSQLGWGWAPSQLNAEGGATSIHFHQSRDGATMIVSRLIGGYPDGRLCIVAVANDYNRRGRW